MVDSEEIIIALENGASVDDMPSTALTAQALQKAIEYSKEIDIKIDDSIERHYHGAHGKHV